MWMGDDERHKSDNRRGEERKLKLPFTSAVQFSVDSVIFHKVGFRQIVIYQFKAAWFSFHVRK